MLVAREPILKQVLIELNTITCTLINKLITHTMQVTLFLKTLFKSIII